MKRLSRLLLAAVLLVAAGAVPGLNAASLSDDDVAGPVQPEPIASTCGYSLGDEENARANCENNAANYCINMGCKAAIITTWHPSWVDPQGYTRICCTFACDCSVVVAAK